MPTGYLPRFAASRIVAAAGSMLVVALPIAGPADVAFGSADGVSGCTIVTVARGGRVVFGGNDDYTDRDSVYWVDPPAPGRHGAIWIGPRDNVQQGFNGKGLAYDSNGLPAVPTAPHRERAPVAGGYTSYPIEILRACATVDEVLTWVRSHQWHARMWDQMHFADASGDAVVISAGADGELAFTRKPKGDAFLVSTNFNLANPAHGRYPCWRHARATELLSSLQPADRVDVARVAAVMDAVHVARSTEWTKVTVVADLVDRTVDVYYFHQFDRPITLRIDDELARPRQDVRLSALFPPDTLRRADAAYERLVAAYRRWGAIAAAWLVSVAVSVIVVRFRAGASVGGRWRATAAALVLGPVALAVWLAAGPRRAAPSGRAWLRLACLASHAVAPCAAATVLAVSAILLVPALERAAGLQAVVMYGLPLAFVWLSRPPVGASEALPGALAPATVLHALVVTHLGLAGIWPAVLGGMPPLLSRVGSSSLAIVLCWGLAAAGALAGGALVTAYLAVTPNPSWRRSWWWVVVSLVVLVGGVVLGGALAR